MSNRRKTVREATTIHVAEAGGRRALCGNRGRVSTEIRRINCVPCAEKAQEVLDEMLARQAQEEAPGLPAAPWAAYQPPAGREAPWRA